MTHESAQIVELMDRFPLETRRELRDAILRIADVFRQTGSAELTPPPKTAHESNVVPIRRLHTEST